MHVKRIQQSREYAIEQIKGMNGEGQPFFAYILTRGNSAEKLQQRLNQPGVNLTDFGDILFLGKGHYPSSDVEERVLKQFQECYLKDR